jgi:hypothetical protein
MKFHVANKIRKEIACAMKTDLIIYTRINYRKYYRLLK